jgi:squalene cyclase
LPAARYQPLEGYALAHEVSTAFLNGFARTQDSLDRDDLDYLRQVLPAVAMGFAARNNVDLVAELLSAMTYLEFHTLPAYRKAVEFLLRSQNPDGTWGDYESQRATFGDGVDQKFYLHTTMVTLRALLEAHDGAWLRAAPISARSAR